MDLLEFKKIKYGDSMVDLKKVDKEYRENEKNRRKYFLLISIHKTDTFEFIALKNKIIWDNEKKERNN
jgi:hypothetical protein